MFETILSVKDWLRRQMIGNIKGFYTIYHGMTREGGCPQPPWGRRLRRVGTRALPPRLRLLPRGVVSGSLRREDLKIAWYGDRLGVVNPTAKSGVVSVRTGDDMIEYGRLRRYGRGLFSRAIELEVQPYDLLVFGKAAK